MKKVEEGEIVAFTVDLFQTACRLNHYPPIGPSEELQGRAAHLCSTLSTPVQRAAPPTLSFAVFTQSRCVSAGAEEEKKQDVLFKCENH